MKNKGDIPDNLREAASHMLSALEEHEFVPYESFIDGENFGNSAVYLASGEFRLRLTYERGFRELAVGYQLSHNAWYFVSNLARFKGWALMSLSFDQQLEMISTRYKDLAKILAGGENSQLTRELIDFCYANFKKPRG